MNPFENTKLFDNVSLSDIFKKIHKNNNKTDKQIDELINDLRPHINSAGEIVMIMPMIKELMDVNIKNNEQLVKIAGIAQRTLNTTNNTELFDLNEVEDLVKQHELNAAEGTKLLQSGEQIKIEAAK